MQGRASGGARALFSLLAFWPALLCLAAAPAGAQGDDQRLVLEEPSAAPSPYWNEADLSHKSSTLQTIEQALERTLRQAEALESRASEIAGEMERKRAEARAARQAEQAVQAAMQAAEAAIEGTKQRRAAEAARLAAAEEALGRRLAMQRLSAVIHGETAPGPGDWAASIRRQAWRASAGFSHLVCEGARRNLERIDAERAELEKAMVAYRGQWETLNREAERLESEIGVSEEELAHLRAYGQQSRESLAALQIRRQALRKLVEHLMRQKSVGAEAQAGPSGAGRDDSFLIAGQSGEPSAAWTAPPISALPEPEEALVLAAAESPGVDIYSSEWRSIHVVAPGRIAFAGDLRGYGKTIVVDHEDGYFTVYAYLERLFAATGDRAARGDVIALSARRPEGSAQPAAHFEVWHGETPVRPESWSGLPGDARRALLDGVFEP